MYGSLSGSRCRCVHRRLPRAGERPHSAEQLAAIHLAIGSYVRPAARHLPLATMGVRMRVRRQAVWRARGTRLSSALPETARPAVLPITLFSACRRVERARARRLPRAPARRAVAAAGATPPCARWTQKPSSPASWMTMPGKILPVRACALSRSLPRWPKSPATSPLRIGCLDIFSPPPGESEVISQVERDSSKDTKIAARLTCMEA